MTQEAKTTIVAVTKHLGCDPAIAVGGSQGWVRLHLSEADISFSLSPAAAFELARQLTQTGWDQR